MMASKEQNGQYWINKLHLKPHPEGGYYAEVFRSTHSISTQDKLARSASTSIYYLLNRGEKSCLHRLASDEVWYFHAGGAAHIHLFYDHGSYEKITIGHDANLQVAIPAGTVFGVSLADSTEYILVGCMVAPGFEFEDFAFVDSIEMNRRFPHYQELIAKMTIS